jgi:RHH-type proline utilization regulon transcriptional repressor/proline dehydrogenase/delta 1-pyrroline-5-carboxylate dehydrogenase
MVDRSTLRDEIRTAPFRPEADVATGLSGKVPLDAAERAAVSARAAELIERIRSAKAPHLMESLLAEFELSSEEGVALMCLAEAYLRVPDAPTMDALIRDKIGGHDWGAHAGGSESLLVNASTWGLMLTGRIYEDDDEPEAKIVRSLRHLVQRLGEPVLRIAVGNAMKVMAQQFVLGRSISEAIERAGEREASGFRYSYDMLGEAARTDEDARRYFLSYSRAIAAIADHVSSSGRHEVHDNPGISVKLSALHPRYETTQRGRVMDELVPRLSALAEMARNANIGFSVDAEEADRLDLSLDVVEATLRNADLAGWDGFGLVVQAYAKTALPVIDWFAATAGQLKRRVALRLVKGAYWDFEIKNAQVTGMEAYPVFTRKQTTDVSYLAAAARLLDARETIYPQFATHNAHTCAAILNMSGDTSGFEFQRLHGMGEALHDLLMADHGRPCRIYAPVGVHRDLLAYLVRRLLENGANSSFVNQLLDEEVPAAELAADPLSFLETADPLPHPKIPLPPNLFQPERENSAGWNIQNPGHAARLDEAIAPHAGERWEAAPLIGGEALTGEPQTLVNPADHADAVGQVIWADADAAEQAVATGLDAFAGWRDRPVAERAAIIRRCADLYEANSGELMGLMMREAGKTRLDAALELREAVDFCRYYAAQAEQALAAEWRGRGLFVCISPWNFPLAIFTGQITAALVAGNCVIAKPAEQTPLTAAGAVRLMHEAGVPKEVLALLPGDGATVGGALVGDPRIAGVCFTGSTETAILIDRAMAEKGNPQAPLIAETGGLNAMIVDSTALPEHAVRDIVASSFQSAGQRCSALRVLFVQDEIADPLLEMLEGATKALRVGNSWVADVDVGPVIDKEAKAGIESHCARLEKQGRLLFRHPMNDVPASGTFVAPQALRLDSYSDLKSEIFGPILHVVRFRGSEINDVLAEINRSGFGLTFGVHSRLDDRVDWLCKHVHAGNIYVNRNQIGAVVGVQPFGGEGLSGTGPKAGGPLYLPQFCVRAGYNAPEEKGQSADAAIPAAGRLSAAVEGAASAPAISLTDAAAMAGRISEGLPDGLKRAAESALEDIRTMATLAGRLPGPTGESNDLAFHGRGIALCLGGGERHDVSLCRQAIAAMAAANAAILPADPAGAVIRAAAAAAGVGDRVRLADDAGDPKSIAEAGPLDLVMHDGDAEAVRDIRRALASRPGIRVPVIFRVDGPQRLVLERVVSVDTTASGGNTTLLMLDD